MFDKEYIFYGKHASMVKELNAKFSDEVGRGFFENNYEVYRLAPIVGYIYNQKGVLDKTNETTKVFGDKMLKEAEDLKFNYRVLMMLLLKNMSNEEKLDITFKLDNKDNERKAYDDLYNSYVLGGMEVIYEKLMDTTHEVDELMMNMYEFIENIFMRVYAK